MKPQQGKGKIYVKFRNGNKIVETYVDSQQETKDLYELIKEQVFGDNNNGKKNQAGFVKNE